MWSSRTLRSYVLRDRSPKKYQIKKKLLLTKYEHVADVVLKVYSCATCVKGVKGG